LTSGFCNSGASSGAVLRNVIHEQAQKGLKRK
jgi:hypothetical protein